jgi:hypothetical protein
MRENRTCGSEGGAAELNRSFLPLSRPLRGGILRRETGAVPILFGTMVASW